MSNQDELKKLMQERRKQKMQSQELPKNAQLIDGLLICIECQQKCDTLIDFQRHLQSQKHKNALQVLKRNAQIDVSRLENEAYRVVKQKKQGLTKQQIEKINLEVDNEFAEIEQIAQQQNNDNQLPADFFDQIEIETKIQQQLQVEHLKKQQEQEMQNKNEDINVENQKEEVQKLREKIIKQKQQKLNKFEFEFDQDVGEDEGFTLNWKQKGKK